MHKRLASAPLSLLLLCAGSARLQAPPDATALAPVPERIRAGHDAITPELCREWLTVLAADEMGGRATGTAGYEKAARYVAERFKELGLKPVGDQEGDLEGYFQRVPFGEVVANPAESHFLLQDAAGTELARVAFGAGLGGFVNANADRVYELAFIRAGTQKELDDLLAGAGGEESALEGKAVLLLERGARLMPGRGRRGRRADAAPGIVIRIDDRQAAAATGRPRYLGPNRGVTFNPPRPNSYAVTRDVAERLLVAAGIEAGELDRAEPALLPARGARLAVKVQTMEKPAFAVNVVGLLEGSDPQLKEEVVGVGSHLDHIGTGPDGRVNNGADDDGSGTTGVLAVAHALALNPVKPKRSVLFMCFCAEELGLQGSLYYSLKPVIPNARMVAELQMDMIGRNEESATERASDNLNTLHLIGTEKLSAELHELCLSVNRQHVGFDYEFDAEDVFFRSDHVNFAKEDIPVAFFFTGFHPQYHRHDDEVDLIDFPKLARVARLVYLITFEVADRTARLQVDRNWAEIDAARTGARRQRPSRPTSQPVR